jgi:hypothetical protein
MCLTLPREEAHSVAKSRYFVGAAWAAGMDISSGMFVPMLLIGAVLGRLMGLITVDIIGIDMDAWHTPAEEAQWKWVDPGVFAIVGAAGFMGGVTRLTITLAAIMMEVQIQSNFPLKWGFPKGSCLAVEDFHINFVKIAMVGCEHTQSQ